MKLIKDIGVAGYFKGGILPSSNPYNGSSFPTTPHYY